MSLQAASRTTQDMVAPAWGSTFFPAHCRNCRASFLIPKHAGAPFCPNCLGARLEPQPALERDAPPELVVPFALPNATLNANLARWQRDIPFKPASLELSALQSRLTPIFLPMYLADASVAGIWHAQMGFDYLVASSEESFDGKTWATLRINETRVRWEPRAGEVTRKYENVPAPALEQHARWMVWLGAANRRETPFDTSRAIPYTAETLGKAFVRAPELAPDTAWQFAREELERRMARDCATAASAQHHEQFSLQATFGEPNWTLLLVPVYVASYLDDDSKWQPVWINGQTGLVSGIKRASGKRARRWTFAILITAFAAFALTVIVGLAAPENQRFGAAALLLLVLTFALCLAAPVPLLIVWQYNRRQME